MGSDGIRVYCDVPFFVHKEWLNAPHCTRERGHENLEARSSATWRPEDHASFGRFFWVDQPKVSNLLSARDVIAYEHAHQKLGWLNGIERVRLLNSGGVRIPTDICALLRRGRSLGEPMYPPLAILQLADFINLTSKYSPLRRSA